jgi:hypothetical protein
MLPDLVVLAATDQGHWRPGIGDPTPVGWLTVLAYLAAAGACGVNWIAERRAARAGRPADPTFWLALGGLLLFLGINKQLDLQTLLGSIGRELARSQGWYAERRFYQVLFIACLGAAGLAALAVLCWAARRRWKRNVLPLTGVVFLYVFVLTRASSFHHVDVLLRSSVLGVRWNWILELGGIATVAAGALAAMRDRRRSGAAGSAAARGDRDPTGARRYVFERGILVPRDGPSDSTKRRR